MIKKHWKWVVAIAGLVAFLMVFKANVVQGAEPVRHTDKIIPGELGYVWAYCEANSIEDTTAARTFSKAVAEKGVAGYEEIMRDINIKCYDTRMSNNPTKIEVMLLEKVWSFTAKEGTVFDMWYLVNSAGNNGFTWHLPKDLKREQAA